jgi:hypothetical protein
VLRELDGELDVSPGALAVVTHYLDMWAHAAFERDVFAWRGSEDPTVVWTVLRTWYAIAGARAAIADRIGQSVAPPEAVAFEEVLLSGLLRALADHDLDGGVDNDQTRVAKLARAWPTTRTPQHH